MAKKWKRVESKIWKPENEGESIEGVLIAKEPKTEDIGAKYTIENKEGAFLIWGSAILDDKMHQVPVGSEVRITYEGQKKLDGKKKLNLYELDVAESDKEETPAVKEEAVE